MSNLRILKKLDGSVELQSLVATSVGGSCEYWAKVGVDITVEKQQKSLAQVLSEAFLGPHMDWSNSSYVQEWEKTAQAAMDYLEKEGWRRPNG